MNLFISLYLYLRRDACRVLMEKPEVRNHSENPSVDGRTILKRIFERLDGGIETGSIWLRIGTGGGLF